MAGASNNKVIAWSECQISVGATGDSTTSFDKIGTIKDQSAVFSTSDGNTLELKATGGHTVAYEQQEGTATLTCRVIEPDFSFYKLFGITSTATAGNEIKITTLLCQEEKSVKLTPKNIGAYGLVAPFCSVSIKTGWSETEGNYADVTFGILCKVATNDSSYWYKLIKKEAPAGA